MIFISCLLLFIYSYIPYTISVISTPILKFKHGGCFSSWCQTGWYSSPAYYQNPNNNTENIIVSALYDITAINPDGSLNWRYSDSSRVWAGVALADNKIIVGKGAGKIFTLDKTGSLIKSMTTLDGNEVRSIAIGNMNGNIYIIAGETGNGINTYVYDTSLNLLNNWPQIKIENSTNGYSHGVYNDNIGICDINNDGIDDIIVPSDVHYVAAYDINGIPLSVNSKYKNSIWGAVGIWVNESYDIQGYGPCGSEYNSYNTFRPNFANGPVSIFKFFDEELLVISGNVYNCTNNGYINTWIGPFLFKKDHTRYINKQYNIDWTVPPTFTGKPLSENYTIIENIQGNIAIGDLNNDGFPEFVFSSYDGKIHVFSILDTINEPNNWPYSVTNSNENIIRFSSEPIIVDIDNDGKFEVIVQTWVQKNSGKNGDLLILDYAGNLLHKISLGNGKNGNANNGGLAAPTVGYISGGKNLEVILTTVGSGLIMYEIPNSENAKFQWYTGRGNFYRNGKMTPMINFKGETIDYNNISDNSSELVSVKIVGMFVFIVLVMCWM